MQKRTALWLLLGIIIVGVFLRSYHLTTRSLWLDESFSWRLIQFPFSEMISRTAADVHPPFYYVALRVWAIVFGSSVLSLRAFSVMAAALTMLAAYLFTTTAFRSRPSGLLAVALLAVSGWQIAFAWEARMYTFGTALALFSSWFLVKWLRAVEPRSPAPSLALVLGYVITATIFVYTHYFAFFILAAHALVVLGYIVMKSRGRLGEIFQSRTLWQAGLAASLIALLYAPWVPVVVRQAQQVQAGYWVPAPETWSLADTFYRFFFPTISEPAHTWPASFRTLAPLATVLIVWAVLLVRRHRVFENWLVVTAGAFPIAAAWATVYVGQSLYNDRFLVFANIFVLIAIAALLTHLRPRSMAFSLSLLVLLALGASFARYVQELNIPARPGLRAAVTSIPANPAQPETIIVSSPFIFFPAAYYAGQGGYAAPRLLSDTVDLAHFAGGPIITPGDVIPSAELATLPGSRLWFLDTTGFSHFPLELKTPWRAIGQQAFPEVFPHQGKIILTEYRRQ